MSKSRKKCGCGIDSHDITDPCDKSRSKQYGRGKFLFPTDIKSLLILIAEDDDENNRASIVLDACSDHCFIEDARVIAVMDNTVVLRDCDKFRFIDICCICEVIVDCDVILDELFEQHSLNRD